MLQSVLHKAGRVWCSNHLDMARDNHMDDIETLINHEHKDLEHNLAGSISYVYQGFMY